MTRRKNTGRLGGTIGPACVDRSCQTPYYRKFVRLVVDCEVAMPTGWGGVVESSIREPFTCRVARRAFVKPT